MKLVLVPLMNSKEERQILIEKTIEVAKQIEDESKQLHIIAGILTATDKFINDDYAKKVKEWIKMTKVARLFEEEKQQAVQQAVTEAKKEAEKVKALKIAKRLLNIHSIEEVANLTDLTVDEVKHLAKSKEN